MELPKVGCRSRGRVGADDKRCGCRCGGKGGGLGLGLNSCMGEERQALVTGSYLRLGLVEQRELVPVAAVKRDDLDGQVTLSLPAQPTLSVSELCPGTSGSPWCRDRPGPSETAGS